MKRTKSVSRKTQETDIRLDLCIDGKGDSQIQTPVPFIDHMLTLLAKHGFFDLAIRAKGDTEVDYHHTVEDIGICLGSGFKGALGDKKGIRRFGEATVPMTDALASVVLDWSGRPHLVFQADFPSSRVGDMDVELFEEFFRAFCSNAGLDLHIRLFYGSNVHHSIEAIFKATARALDMATQIDPRQPGIQSTKGSLDP
jgi:imidazoleglycerol-phosphate dehydratase